MEAGSFHCMLTSWAHACNQQSNPLGDLASAVEVGSGLFLGLAVIQVVGSGRLATLRRKVDGMRNTINKNNVVSCYTLAGKLDLKLLSVEMGLEKLSDIFFRISTLFLIGNLSLLMLVSIFPERALNCFEVFFILFYCLFFPVTLVVISASVISHKTKPVVQDIADAQERVLADLAANLTK